MTHEEWLETNPLRQWRLSQEPPLSAYRLARRMQVTIRGLRNWELGKRTPRIDALQILIHHCDISVDQWMDWLNKKPKGAQHGQCLAAQPT